jgi:hypothetical protein
MGPMLDPAYVARQRTLIKRVDSLWTKGLLTGPMIEQARASDNVLSIDVEDGRFTVATLPRAVFALDVPPDCPDKVFLAMAAGQPPLRMGETVAAWFIATEWEGGEPVAVVRGPISAWRDAHGTA